MGLFITEAAWRAEEDAESLAQQIAEAERELLASIEAVKNEPAREEFRVALVHWAERLALLAELVEL